MLRLDPLVSRRLFLALVVQINQGLAYVLEQCARGNNRIMLGHECAVHVRRTVSSGPDFARGVLREVNWHRSSTLMTPI